MSKHLDEAKLLEWLHDKWNQFGANNDLFEQEAIEQIMIEVKRGAFDADESEGTWKATSEFAFRLNDQLEAENQRLRVALEEIRDHAIRFGLATVHMKAEKALSTTTEPPANAAKMERVRELWDITKQRVDEPEDYLQQEYFAGKAIGIMDTLNALGVTIPGINAQEGDRNDA